MPDAEPMVGETYKLRNPKTVCSAGLLFKCNNIGTDESGQGVVTLTNVQTNSRASVGLQYFRKSYITSAQLKPSPVDHTLYANHKVYVDRTPVDSAPVDRKPVDSKPVDRTLYVDSTLYGDRTI